MNLKQKKKKPNSKYWRSKADALWGSIIHSKYGECLINDEHCHGRLEAHHLISRGKGVTRHDLNNGVLLCTNHHKFSIQCSPHMGQIGFADWLKENQPEKYHYFLTNRWRNEKHNYREACERLAEWK